jgi:acetyl esterase/lipase
LDRFDRIDRNRDGKVTPDELRQPQLFKRLDRNNHGVIDRSEAQAAEGRGAGRGRDRAPNAPGAGAGELTMPAEPPHDKHLNIRYAEIAGVDPNLLSLDLYVPKGTAPDAKRPVVIMIHGGGWRNGDKANPPIIGAKMRHFVGAGYIYASINYRLSPQTPSPDGVRHPAHVEDCAAAIAWIHDHIAEYGGDPERLHLMGHSAGGHLAGLVATNERFLKAHGKPLSIIKTNVLLDPAALDILRFVELTKERGMTALYELAFGKDPAVWRDASPSLHVKTGKGIPPTLIFYAGDRMRLDVLATALADSLTKAGSPSRAVDTVSLDHGQINSLIGMVGDPMTALIMRLHAGEDASTFTGTLGAPAGQAPPGDTPDDAAAVDAAGAEPSADSPHAWGVRFTQDFVAGTKDRHGTLMNGTETMRLISHAGKVFAGLSTWTDDSETGSATGAQILVKAGPDQPWEVDATFPGVMRISAMTTATFTNDHRGTKLASPVTLLLADAAQNSSRRTGMLRVMVRKDAAGRWDESVVRDGASNAFIRAFGVHRDAVTGVDLVFAGTGAGEIYAGAYDPSLPGRIRWNTTPEYSSPDFANTSFTRVSAFCVANGRAYCSASPRLLERQDGRTPTWKEVYTWAADTSRNGAGLRGITAVPSPDGRYEVIVGAWEREGQILRIDPRDDFEAVVELNTQEFLRKQLGDFRGGRLTAYNRFEPGTHPRTGKPIHWVTVAGVKPDEPNAAWLMMRHPDGRYEVLRVFDPSASRASPLVSTRTVEVSPWSPREFFTGGYDGAANQRNNRNTAWIYRAILDQR